MVKRYITCILASFRVALLASGKVTRRTLPGGRLQVYRRTSLREDRLEQRKPIDTPNRKKYAS
jgi:hypothetical protein